MRSIDFLNYLETCFTINKIFSEVNLLALDYVEFLSEYKLCKKINLQIFKRFQE